MNCPKCQTEMELIKSIDVDNRFHSAYHCKTKWIIMDGKILNPPNKKDKGERK